jgi:hypothetical protein
VLGLVPVEPPLVNRRHQKPAAALSAVAIDGEHAWLLTPAELPHNAGLYPGGTAVREEARRRDEGRPGVLHDPRQALFAAAFSPNGCGGAVMLAAGGAAGLVRLHRLMVAVQGGRQRDAYVD